jgi:hypothetical protein
VEDLPWIRMDHMESVSLALSMKFDGLLDVCIHKQYVGQRVFLLDRCVALLQYYHISSSTIGEITIPD